MKVVIFSVILISMVAQPVFASNENLYVSRDVAEQQISEKYYSQLDNTYSFTEGCTSFAPLNYSHKSYLFYIDVLNPTFDVGFSKNEYPLVIDSTSFSKSDFLKSKTVSLETNKPVDVKILLFENRGPQNIQNVTLYANLKDSFSFDQSTTYISLEKDPPEPVSDPIQNYIRGQIEEDFGQSYRYDRPWASYSVKTNDPNGIFEKVSSTFSKKGHKLETVFEITFQKPIPKSNLVITASDVNGNTMTCFVKDAWEISSSDIELPNWFENNLDWYNQGMISESDYQNAKKFLFQVGKP